MKTREQKISALAENMVRENYGHAAFGPIEEIKAAVLAGIRLRDEELLAMEFDGDAAEFHKIADKYLCQALKEGKDDSTLTDVIFFSGVDCAKHQHEQFMKAIKGDI